MTTPDSSKLFAAIASGDLASLRELIASGCDVNAMRIDTSDSDKLAGYAQMSPEAIYRQMGVPERDISRASEYFQSLPAGQADAMMAGLKNMMNMAAQLTRAVESPKTALMAAAAQGRADMLETVAGRRRVGQRCCSLRL